MPDTVILSIASGLLAGACAWLLDRRLAWSFAETAGADPKTASSGWLVAGYLAVSAPATCLLLTARYQLGPRLIFLEIVTVILLWIASVDWRWRIIPNRIVYPASLAALVLSPMVKPGPMSQAVIYTLIGLIASGGVFLLFYLLSVLLYRRGDAFGLGDVKLASFVGIALGYPGAVGAVFLATFAGAVIALGWGIAYRSRKVGFPYGPAIVIGAIAAMLIAPTGAAS